MRKKYNCVKPRFILLAIIQVLSHGHWTAVEKDKKISAARSEITKNYISLNQKCTFDVQFLKPELCLPYHRHNTGVCVVAHGLGHTLPAAHTYPDGQ